MTTHAAAAKQIRQELKAAFPNVQFSIKSESFSMGESVTIRWSEGPEAADVANLTAKYQYGQFDATTDYFSRDNARTDIPQVMFVKTRRMAA